jgi:hypothetical protein
MTDTVVIDTYEITATHPALSEPLVMELIATSEHAAISRARGTAVHMYRDVRLLDAEYAVTSKKDGVWPDRAEGCACGNTETHGPHE